MLFYCLNLLAAILFATIALYPLLGYLYLGWTGAPQTALKWNDCVIVAIWYGYTLFCLRKLVRYLRRPTDSEQYFFLYSLLGLIPVYFLIIMLAMAGFGYIGAN